MKIHIAKLKNDATLGAEYTNENDSEDTERNKTSAIPNFIPKIISDDQIAGINSLNSKQRKSLMYFINGLKII